MRAPLLLACIIVVASLPSASATEPSAPFWLTFASEGAPEPGRPFELVVTARGDAGGRETLVLSVPQGVVIEGERVWRIDVGPDATVERRWTLTAPSNGMWAVRLLDEDEQRTRACCLYVRTWEGDSVAAASPVEAVAPVDFAHNVEARAVNASHVRITYVIEAQRPWLQETRRVLSFSPERDGSATVFDGDAPTRLDRDIALRSGGTTEVTLHSFGVAWFSSVGGPLEDFAGDEYPIRCVKGDLARSGDIVTWTETGPCAGTMTPGAESRSPVPGGFAAAAMAAGICAALLRRKRHAW